MPSASTKGGKQRAGRTKQQESAPMAMGNLHFLGIGINEYQSADWPNLNNAVRDVRAIADLLQQDYGLSEKRTTYLEDEAATRAGIIGELNKLSERVKPFDSLIIYYAGHGHLTTKNDKKSGYWVPTDGTSKGIYSFVRNGTIRDLLAEIDSLHTLLISDSCFSGSLFVRGKRSSKLTAMELRKLPSRWAICSVRHNETVADGPPEGHSPFAESILDVLSSTEREYITTNFLFEQVRDQTRSNYEQIPDGGPLARVGHKRGEFVFLRTPQEDPDAERIAELEAELAKCDEQLLQKAFRQTKRRLRVLKEEIHEELQSEAAKTRLLAAVEQRIGFCDSYRQYSEWYERLEERALSRSEKQQEENEKLAAQLASLKKQLTEVKAAENKQRDRIQELKKLNRTLERSIKKQEVEQQNPRLQSPEPLPNAPDAIKSIMNNMVLVKGGAFEMGDVFNEGNNNEKPVHQVTLQDFYMGIHAVTFAEYDLYWMLTGAESPSDKGWGRNRHPVINVSWFDAVKYCNWLSEQTGRSPVYSITDKRVTTNWGAAGFRLPTEAEWEYAAREGGQKVRFGTGKDEATSSEINFDARSSSTYSKQGVYRRQTVKVGSLNSPNALGLHDMSGNVWEWCWDWRGDYQVSMQEHPTGPLLGHYRVLRGGSWRYDPWGCRVTYRRGSDPTRRYYDIGFRVVLGVGGQY